MYSLLWLAHINKGEMHMHCVLYWFWMSYSYLQSPGRCRQITLSRHESKNGEASRESVTNMVVTDNCVRFWGLSSFWGLSRLDPLRGPSNLLVPFSARRHCSNMCSGSVQVLTGASVEGVKGTLSICKSEKQLSCQKNWFLASQSELSNRSIYII